MTKLFLTMILAFSTMIASAQWSAMATVVKIEGTPACEPGAECEVYTGEGCPTEEDSWNVTDKIGIGYQVNEKLLVGITMDGEDKYELLGRYELMNGIWGTCVYNYAKDSEAEHMDNIELGVGYYYKV